MIKLINKEKDIKKFENLMSAINYCEDEYNINELNYFDLLKIYKENTINKNDFDTSLSKFCEYTLMNSTFINDKIDNLKDNKAVLFEYYILFNKELIKVYNIVNKNEINMDLLNEIIGTYDLKLVVDEQDKFIIYDDMDGFYDLYTFKDKVNIEDIKKIVKNIKDNYIDTWSLEDIEKEIIKNFKVESVKQFDYIACNILNVNDDLD